MNRWWITIIVASIFTLGAGGLWQWNSAENQRLDNACRMAQSQRRWKELEQTARIWSRYRPNDADAWVFLADAVQHQDRFLEAAEYLGRVPLESPKFVPSLLARTNMLFGPANRPIEGAEAARHLLQVEPLATEGHNRLIEFYAITLQRQELRDQVRQAIHLKREWPVVYVYYFLSNTLRMANGIQTNELWLRSYVGQEQYLNLADELFSVARVLHMEDKEVEAVLDVVSTQTLSSPDNASFTRNSESTGSHNHPPTPPSNASVRSEKERHVGELLKRFPRNLNLLSNELELQVAFGRLDRVIDLLSQAPPEAERDNRFWRYKGWVHYVDRDYDKAEDAYRHSLKLFPLDWYTLQRLAELLRVKNQLVEAEHLQKLVADANTLRGKLRKLPEIERISVEMLSELAVYARGCGEHEVAAALEHRIAAQRKSGLGSLPSRTETSNK